MGGRAGGVRVAREGLPPRQWEPRSEGRTASVAGHQVDGCPQLLCTEHAAHLWSPCPNGPCSHCTCEPCGRLQTCQMSPDQEVVGPGVPWLGGQGPLFAGPLRALALGSCPLLCLHLEVPAHEGHPLSGSLLAQNRGQQRLQQVRPDLGWTFCCIRASEPTAQSSLLHRQTQESGIKESVSWGTQRTQDVPCEARRPLERGHSTEIPVVQPRKPVRTPRAGSGAARRRWGRDGGWG